MFVITQQAVDEQNARALKGAAPVPEVPVPHAADGVGRVRGPGRPAMSRMKPGPGTPVRSRDMDPANFRRPYIAEGHAAPSPGNEAA